MQNPNPPSLSDKWALILQSAIKSRDPFIGRCIHAPIIKHGLCLGVFLMNNLLNFYAKTGFFSDAHCLFHEMPLKTTFSWNTILSMHVKGGHLDSARQLFDEIPHPDSVSWTTMIVGYNHLGLFNTAINTFLRMVSSGISPTQFTFTNVLASCSAKKALNVGNKVHSFVVKLGLSGVVPVANSLLNMYAKCGDSVMAKVVFERMRLKDKSTWNTMISMHMQFGRLDLALSLFDQMSDPDIVSWNSIITGYCHQGRDIKALEMFSSMLKSSSLNPDKFTLASVLSACANPQSLKLGKQIHAHIVRVDIDTAGAVGNALISMYAKSGAVGIARRIVQLTGTSSLNVIAFTSLLDGYVKIGDINPAREIFDSLKCPDVVAWTAMIVGYAQNDLISNALALFRLMIREGPKPNSYTLAAMLSIFSSLASLDHACGKWEDAAKVRKSMKDRAVKKEQGFSWVQIQNKVHTFGVDDALHPQRDAIYRMISKIWNEIKKMGFIPDTNSVLHDLEQEVKEQILRHHSEKLAIAFALINTPEHSTLRIMKNLRVCNDCHSAIKYISKLVKREIIVRDATRFHHFNDGSCSCQDYW
ncbi:hypothetical protein VIGAN_08063800 [Vigna angularis var. angularis]|uniref:DYW domain-containing protein n=1 Tax=Vigna angularis var. angularis TaxID=157739 RepID=A0A0S3SMP6_PHAAN|nr:hypothetical protein VIGAN_08063800 [Vigna angularis var. angularis]